MTDWDAIARPSLRGLERYDPGETRDALRARLGLDHLEPLNWNEDRFGPPPEVLAAAAAELDSVALYPERLYAEFRDAVARARHVPPETVIPAHGAQSLIGTIASAFLEPGRAVVVPAPTYGLYAQVSAAAGAQVIRVPGDVSGFDLVGMAAAADRAEATLVWLADPNNPTGGVIGRDHWRAFLEALPPGCAVVADEAYGDFADPAVMADRREDVLAGRPVIMIRSFSKTFGLAGLRLGFAIADPAVARLLDIVQEPFNVNRIALAAGRAGVQLDGFVECRRAEVASARDVLRHGLERIGVSSLPSQANFVLADLAMDERPVTSELITRGVLIRPGSEFGLPGWVRITVAPEPVMRRLIELLAAALGRMP
ncbi:MAG TPA: histidinol-phosphate transaminase [Gaiellales bacterium]|nr:histidinol-phosphate transaminase [Gaiellales bacterium]